MQSLGSDECRVLGVLIEKAQTVPAAYPMTLNAIVNACNQLNNRQPVLQLDEDRVVRALEGLRDKRVAVFVNAAGSRVMKYRHCAQEALAAELPELVILAELLLRGPRTLGEIRGRASRMHPLGSLDEVRATLQRMIDRPEALVRRLPAGRGSRAERYAQLLRPDLHAVGSPGAEAVEGSPRAQGAAEVAQATPSGALSQLEARVARLEQVVQRLAQSLGATDMLQ